MKKFLIKFFLFILFFLKIIVLLFLKKILVLIVTAMDYKLEQVNKLISNKKY
nr:hypothetical protein [Borreliella yangtzensis]WKC74767.1 hypothetical protein QIA36_00155 [Borreliella yangtzensis]